MATPYAPGQLGNVFYSPSGQPIGTSESFSPTTNPIGQRTPLTTNLGAPAGPSSQPGAYLPANILGTLYGIGQTPTSFPGAPLQTQPVYGYTPSAGGVPSVPSPTGTGSSAISGNISNLPSIGQLATGVAGINAQIGAAPYQANLPGYQSNLVQAAANAASNLQGIIPPDVLQQIQDTAAERGVAIGSPGSPNANTAMLRALGLTSLGLQQTGANQLAQLIGETPTGPQFNPASMFITPAQQQLAQLLANIYGAAPIPQAAQNAALGALQRGFGQGQGVTQPTQSAQLASQIAQTYAPTVQGGTPGPAPFPGTVNPYAQATASQQIGDWLQLPDGTWTNTVTGETSLDMPEEIAYPGYYPDTTPLSTDTIQQAGTGDVGGYYQDILSEPVFPEG